MMKISLFTLLGVSDTNAVSADFVFGVLLEDNTYHFDPEDDSGYLVLKSGELPLASNKLWLRQFCSNLKNAPFYVSSYDSCYIIELFLTK